jgi:quinol monooxygenase YgiN
MPKPRPSSPRKPPAARGLMVIVAYRPKPGMGARLLALTRRHVKVLREEGLASARAAHAMRSADGTILEVFEWASPAAMEAAHTNPAVLQMWKDYAKVCDYVPLAGVLESADLFAQFAPVDLE